VSTPVSWPEVDKCAKSGNPETLRFEAKDVLKRIEKYGDLMAPLVATKSRTKSKS
jgi:bifunctional non-homologous end joining protein LigD